MKLVKTPLLFKKLFSNYYWSVATNKKILYLTFDDGPTPEITEQVLDILKQHNAKATFFCIGKNVELHPKIFQRVITEGHSIGNHTQNHIKGWKTNKAEYIKNTLIAEQVISAELNKVKNDECRVQSDVKTQNSNSKSQHKSTNVISNKSEKSQIPSIVNQKSKIKNLFRPPYGQLKSSQGKALQKLGYKIIMWDVISYDWEQSISKEEVLKNVIENATLGSIIVFHDSVKASKNMLYALPKVLEHFSKKGYRFESLK